MGNVYGIAQPLPPPGQFTTVGSADIVCTAGVKTTVITTGAIVAPGPGNFYPIIWGVLAVSFGATPPASLLPAFNLGGSDVQVIGVNILQFVANATLAIPIMLFGANSGSAWVGAGSTVNITLTGATNNYTCRYNGSFASVALFRGLDQ